MKKAFDQTVRDLKRGVNKKVLKVPGIEQKVLDSTSNEAWGPHGSNLADIAQATRNYHEYQMIMSVLWKRINDTGKNWRHVYKALTVLEYLVAYGSERVIDEIREHAYQISTLSDFQYIDSSGRDQGSNVRKKSQALVSLVNDKERILEVREKAAANREKFRSTSSTGGMYRPSSYSSTGGFGDRYDDDRNEGRYGYRDEDRNGYGREKEREWGYKEDDRSGRGDSYSRDGDRYGRESDERYGRDGYRDDDYRGRNRSDDEYQQGSINGGSDRDRAFEDDGRYSSRSSGARADEHSQDEKRLERKFSEQNIGVPPSYEDVINNARSPVRDERAVEPAPAPAPAPAPIPKASPQLGSTSQTQVTPVIDAVVSPPNQAVDAFDEFDPRGSAAPAAPPTGNSAEVDLFGSLSETFSSNSLALVPVSSETTTAASDSPINSSFGPTFVALSSASTVLSQPIDDPFGDGPFKAAPSLDNVQSPPPTSFQTTITPVSEPVLQAPPTSTNFEFGDTFLGITYTPSNIQENFSPELSTTPQNTDILANILPLSGPTSQFAPQSPFLPPTVSHPQPVNNATSQFAPQSPFLPPTVSHPQPVSNATSQFAPQSPFLPPTVLHPQPVNNALGNFLPQSGPTSTVPSQAAFHTPPIPFTQGNFLPQMGPMAPPALQAGYQASMGPVAQTNNVLAQVGPITPLASQTAPPVPTGPPATSQPPKDKFDPKSTVWADTLSRGLVNLNISGPKTNPLADIGVDFESINRKEKREKPVTSPVTSTVTMGKAMGSGSGIGRAGAGAIRPSPNPMMGMGMGMNQPMGMGMGPYGGGMNQPMGMGTYGGGMNQPMGMGMGMGMNMGMGQGVQMRAPAGLPPGPTMQGGYNPMMGTGGYATQHPYGGGYR